MDSSLMSNHVVMSLAGAALYNGIAFVGKSRKEGLKYDLKKGLRAGVSGLIQAAACIGAGWIPPEGVQDQVMIGMAAAFGIDNGMKILGWKAQ